MPQRDALEPDVSVPQMLRHAPGTYHPGWGRIPEYDGWRAEQLAWKETCTFGDWSFLWDIVIEGPDALQLLSDTSVNSFASFAIGQAKHVIQCNRDGKVIAEGVLMRLDEDRFSTQSTPAHYLAWRIHEGSYDVTWREQATFIYQVAGPNALAVMEKVTGESLRDIEFMRFRPTRIAGHEVLALRQGMSGEIGYEIHGPAEVGNDVRDAILEVGRDFGMRRLGNRTALVNHLEASFPTGAWHYLADFFGPDADGFFEFTFSHFDMMGLGLKLRGSFESDDVRDYLRSPVELGWGKSIKFDHEFLGRKALEEEVANPRRGIVTLEFNTQDVIDIYASQFDDQGEPYDFLDVPLPQQWVFWADSVLKDGRHVGVSSVPGYSAYFRKVLALAFLDIAETQTGTQVEVLWGNPGTRQKLIRATVARAPYKQDRRRTDLSAATR